MFRRLIAAFIVITLLFTSLAAIIPATPASADSKALNVAESSGQLNSPSTGTGTTFAPYKNVDNTWTNELALGWAYSRANYQTGFIATSAFSYAGGASAQAEQWIDISIPSGQLSEVSVVASIIYAGGSKKIGIGASAWGGVDKVWYVGNQEHRESLDPVFGSCRPCRSRTCDHLIKTPLRFQLISLQEAEVYGGVSAL